MSKFKNALLAAVGLLLLSNALLLTQRNTAQAQSPGVNLAQLVATVNSLQSQQKTDENTITSQGSTITSQGKTIASQASEIQTLQNLSNGQASEITDLNSLADYQAGQITALQTLTAPLSLSSDPNAGGTNTLLTIKGVNVQIVNGQSSTETQNGLGNLIVGYNEKRGGTADARTGSHNLILGDQNNYSSYGGLIAGIDNTISGPYASVSGGAVNTASGYYASVSGGYSNTASNYYASVSGGGGNTASGNKASVSGGNGNTASNYFASVSGGGGNTASGEDASVSGGNSITQKSDLGWSGGSYHTP